MLLDDRPHDVEPQAGAFHLEAVRLETIEAMEDALQLRPRDADAGDRATRTHTVSGDGAATSTATCTASREYLTALSSRFETTVRSSSASPSTNRPSAVGVAIVSVIFSVDKVMAEPCRVEDLARERCDVDRRALLEREPLPGDTRLEHLFDGPLQALGVVEHDAIEVAALRFGHVTRLERFEKKSNRRDRRLELVGDGVDERVVGVVATDLPHEEHGVDNDAGNDEGKGQDPENERQHAPGVDDNPADVERDRGGDQDHAEPDDQGGGGAATVHTGILARSPLARGCGGRSPAEAAWRWPAVRRSRPFREAAC